MAIKNLMSKNILSVDLDDELNKVQEIFIVHNIHHVLVTDKGKLVGTITLSELNKHLSPNLGTRKETHADISLLRQKAHQIMNRKLVTAPPTTGIYDAVLKFDDHKLTCLPIVDAKNKPVGIITWRDILAILAKQHRLRMKK
jgi:acetoin utilization protein AcuB